MTILLLQGSACSVNFTRFAFSVKILEENLKKMAVTWLTGYPLFWIYGQFKHKICLQSICFYWWVHLNKIHIITELHYIGGCSLSHLDNWPFKKVKCFSHPPLPILVSAVHELGGEMFSPSRAVMANVAPALVQENWVANLSCNSS